MIFESRDMAQKTILFQILTDTQYSREVFPSLKEDFFDNENKFIFKNIKKFQREYKKTPKIQELVISLKSLPDEERKRAAEAMKALKEASKDLKEVDKEVLVKETEEYIKGALFFQSLLKGADAIEEHNDDLMKESFKIAEEAMKFSIETDLGVELFEIGTIAERFKEEEGIKVGVPAFDEMYGGITRKTLNTIMSPSGVGKSAALASFACEMAKQGEDVIIVSLEMSVVQFYRRILSNLFEVPVYGIKNRNKTFLKNKLQEIQRKHPNLGKIIVMEYPAGSLSPLQLEGILDKVAVKKGIKKPVLMVDYLGLMKSDLYSPSVGTYTYVGSIAEELRAIAQKRDLIIFSPMQLNRSAIGNLEANQSTLAESMKVYMTVDSAFLILQTEEMKAQGKMKIYFTKNRFSGKTGHFEIGYDYEHFRFKEAKKLETIEKIDLLDESDEFQKNLDEYLKGKEVVSKVLEEDF